MAGYATALGNARNGTASAWPTVWRTANYEYCLVTTVDWRLLVCQRPRTSTSWTTVDVTNVATPGTASATFGPIEVSDSHFAAALAVDAQGYIHISGNGHQQPMKYIKSTSPHNISSWAQAPNPANWLTSGANYTTYQAYEVFSDGTLIWHQDQSDTANPVGRDQTMWRLGPNPGDTWQPCVGTGEIMTTPNLGVDNAADTDDIPDRAYLLHSFVDLQDTLHCVYVWRMSTSTPSTMSEYFYVRSHDKGSTWENVLGEAVTAPFTYRTTLDGVAGVGAAAIKVGGVSIGGATAGGRCVDKDGHFHFIATGSGANDSSTIPSLSHDTRHNHVWWNGSAWQIDEIFGYGAGWNDGNNVGSVAATLSLLRDDVWMWCYRGVNGPVGLYGSNLTQEAVSGSKFAIRVGNCPPPNTPDGEYDFESGAIYHPALLHAGGYENGRHVTLINLPDGDSPRIFSVGDGPRYTPPS